MADPSAHVGAGNTERKTCGIKRLNETESEGRPETQKRPRSDNLNTSPNAPPNGNASRSSSSQDTAIDGSNNADATASNSLAHLQARYQRLVRALDDSTQQLAALRESKNKTDEEKTELSGKIARMEKEKQEHEMTWRQIEEELLHTNNQLATANEDLVASRNGQSFSWEDKKTRDDAQISKLQDCLRLEKAQRKQLVKQIGKMAEEVARLNIRRHPSQDRYHRDYSSDSSSSSMI